MAPARPSQRRSHGPLTLAAASTVLALGLTGCSLDLSHLAPGGLGSSPSPTPVAAGPVAKDAMATLAEAPAVAVQGQTADSGGQPRETTLTVADSGAASGTVDVEGSEVKVIEIDQQLYVSGDDAFWLGQSAFNPDSDSYADNWVRVKPDVLGIDPQAVLAPAQLAEIITGMIPEKGKAVEEKLDGKAVYRIDLGKKNKIWVTKEKPHTLLRMEIEELAPVEGGDLTTRTQMNVSTPAAADIEKMYDDIASTVKDDLGSSRDSRIEVTWDGQLDMKCQTGGKCSVTGKVKDNGVAADGEDKIQVRMDAKFTNSSLGDKKCDDSGTLEVGGTTSLSCSVDYALAASTNPQSYQINGEGLLSTRGVSGKGKDALAKKVKEQRKTTLEKAGGAPASPSEGN
ncbi:hypothetical protein CLV63_11456 [Murinocardiopsis flavida]|uniref:Lipoprotein n=2 Tax=Murinocardiopsis flavida TaxID=645275 RepID=A0A2P8DEI2_9ACTN|nr:hypothetical protein CLV63_11456 [Murinocardiopsis flavida]